MAGVTGIFNDSAPGGKKLSVFFNTNAGNIALEQRNETEETDSSYDNYTASSTDQPGFILTDSQLATTKLNGVTFVFGLTKQYNKPLKGTTSQDCSCSDPTVNDVSIVSPVYKSLIQTDVGNNALAACSSDESAYVFYISGAQGQTLSIMEEAIGDTSQGYGGAKDITYGSSLAAYYDPDLDYRYCIYQAGVKLNEVRSNGSNNPIEMPSVDPKSPTPLAVVRVNESKKVYLYYRDTDKNLRRCIKESDDWGSVSGVGHRNHKVADDSQITATYDKEHKCIHIFYVASRQQGGIGKIDHAIDKNL
jgi:hypothetical protein